MKIVVVTLALIVALPGLALASAQNASNASNAAVQSQIQTIREQVRRETNAHVYKREHYRHSIRGRARQ